MKTPLERIRLGAFFLAAVVILAVLGYLLAGYKVWEAIWIVVVTLSSVGFAEKSSQSISVQLLTIGLILFGVTAAIYTIGGFIQMVTEGEIDRVIGHRRMTRDIGKMKEHVIICGFGTVGQLLTSSLEQQAQPFVVVDSDNEKLEEARTLGYLCVDGDATEEVTLLAAGVERAKSVITTLPNDAANVFITLTSRNLGPHLQIISRADHETTEKKLRQAGADRIVLPAVVSARQMVRMITHPSTVEMMEAVAASDNLDAELDEIVVAADSGLVGISVRETEAYRKHRLLVVAVKQSSGTMVFNPDADYKFQSKDIIILMGRNEDIERFCAEHGV
ncbi:MAG: potassium channel protein [Planctomycetes bacterium]|nr:potassium channel protein [Planctomycetota bacterium]